MSELSNIFALYLFTDNKFSKGPPGMERIAQYLIDGDFPPKIVSLCTGDSLTDIPTLIQPANTNFVLLLIMNGTQFDSPLIYSAAEKLLDNGMIYACVWGSECERVHDIIDQARFKRHPEETNNNVIITTWHAQESIEEAVWFFLNCAWPATAYQNTCSDWVAAVIGNPEWESRVRDEILHRDDESETD
jgi:hypothetical protein